MTIPKELYGDVFCFDTETAVLGDHVCEFGYALFRETQMHTSNSMFIKPIIPITKEVSEIHQIYDGDVENSPTFKDVAYFIYNQLNSADIHVAYNYEYDRQVLEQEFARAGMKFPVKPVVDPFIFFKQYHKYNKGKTLIKAAEKYGVAYAGAHRAGVDAMVTGNVLFKMAAIKPNFPRTLSILAKKQREWIEAQHIDLAEYFKKVGKEPPREVNFSYYDPINT